MNLICRRGFTLIEILLTVMVLSVCLVSVIGGLIICQRAGLAIGSYHRAALTLNNHFSYIALNAFGMKIAESKIIFDHDSLCKAHVQEDQDLTSQLSVNLEQASITVQCSSGHSQRTVRVSFWKEKGTDEDLQLQ